MAKRAKAPKAAKRPKVEQAEPFFRPFAKLDASRRERAGGEGKAAAPAPATKLPQRAPAPIPPKPPTPAPPPQRRPAAPPPRDDAPQPGDPQTFAVYMAGVHALPGGAAHRIPRTASKLERAGSGDGGVVSDADADARARMRSLVTEGLRFETMDDGERIEGRRLDVDPRELRRLRRGEYAVDGKLDLHGLGADEARHAVEGFVRKRSHDGDRVVLVVHGKGTHSPRGNAVLRGEIAAWLSQGRSARHVAAFATAPDDHGGGGAVLVLLAR